MNDKDRKLIVDNLDQLAFATNFDDLLESLRKKGVFTRAQLEKFDSENFKRHSGEMKSRELYIEIKKRGPDAFQNLLNSLGETGQYPPLMTLTAKKQSPPPVSQEGIPLTCATRFPPANKNVYRMSSKPRGMYIIINIINGIGEYRRGAEEDKMLQQILDEMGFEGNYYVDLTRKEIMGKLKEFNENEKLASVDCCIVALMSHGTVVNGREVLKCKNSSFVDKIDIIEMFSSEECRLPKGQPRIFMFNACRGNGTELKGRVNPPTSDQIVQNTPISAEHTFVLSSCVEGLKSNRSPTHGTFFVLGLYTALRDNSHDTCLRGIVNRANDTIRQLSTEEGFWDLDVETHQIITLKELTTTSALYFNPGL